MGIDLHLDEELKNFFKFFSSIINRKNSQILTYKLRERTSILLVPDNSNLFAKIVVFTAFFLRLILHLSFAVARIFTDSMVNHFTQKSNGNTFKAVGFTKNSVKKRLIKYSISLCKINYTQKWKTIFLHIYEKSNLLVRSDNNTVFSKLEILQITTI
jgi:hypothetical protein